MAEDKDSVELVNTTATGGMPAERVRTPLAALRIYEDLCLGSYDWAAARARIQAMYDGHAPYDSSVLTKLGQSNRCNVNFREMEAIVDSNTAAAWSLIMDVGPLVDCKIDRELLPIDGGGDDWSDIISDEYTRMLREWNGFYYLVDQTLKDCFKYGVGGAVFPNEHDWRPKAFQLGNLKVPASAKFDLDKLGLFCLDDTMTIQELYALTENRDVATKAGWSVGAIKAMLVDVFRARNRSPENKEGTSDWESVQTAMRTYDPRTASMDYDDVRIVHQLVRGADNKGITHYIFHADAGEDVAYLFEKKNRYENMSQVLWLLPHNFGDACKIRSVKGLGHRSLPHCEFSNRFLCQLFDSGMLSSSLLVSLQGAATSEEMQVLRMGAVTALPSNLSPVQTSFLPKMDGLVGLRTLSRDILLNNTGVYRPRMESTQSQNAFPTAQQVREEAKTEARFEKSQATFMYTQWEKFHREIFRRVTRSEYVFSKVALPGQQEAQAFLLRCMRRGVPPQILLVPGSIQVHSTKALGIGSSEDRQAMAMQLQGMKPFMDERGRKWTDRQWALAFLGYWNVDKVFPAQPRDATPSNAMSHAILENNSMLEGRAAMVGSDQLHAIHLQAHLMPLARYVEEFQKFGPQGIQNLREAAQMFQLGLPHCSEHMQYMAQDPTRAAQAEALAKNLQMFAQVGAQVIEASESLMQQQIEGQQEQQDMQSVPPEVQLQMQKNNQKFQLDVQKQDSLNEARMQKASDQAAIKKMSVDFNSQLAAQKAAADVEIKKLVAQAEIALKAAKAGASQPEG